MALRVIFLLCALSASCLAKPSVNITGNGIHQLSSGLQTRIVGGEPAKGPLPYQVSLRVRIDGQTTLSPSSLVHACGGSLITSNIVLTAAVCCNPAVLELIEQERYYAVAGTDKLTYPEETFISKIEKCIPHPAFSGRPHLKNNIAVAKLANSIPTNAEKVGKIPLRSEVTSSGEKCSVSGWGIRSEDDSPTSFPENLHIANLAVVDLDVCKKARSEEINRDMMCAGGEKGGVGACKGDIGGPLVCNGQLTGVVALNVRCEESATVPGTFASVAFHKQWIPVAIKEIGGAPLSEIPAPPTDPNPPTGENPKPDETKPPEPSSSRSTITKSAMDTISLCVLVFSVVFTRKML